MSQLTIERRHDDINLSADELWTGSPELREQQFAILRRERSVSWQTPMMTPTMKLMGLKPPPGYWAIVAHRDVSTVSRTTDVFASSVGGVMFEDLPPVMLDQAFLLSMDEPKHGKYRRTVSSVFTPKRLKTIQEQISNQARIVVDDIATCTGEIEFVSSVSERLPMWTISEMLGIPEEMREEIRYAANTIISWNDPDFLQGRDPITLMMTAIGTLQQRCFELIEARHRKPEDDLMSALIAAEVDGHRLDDNDIYNFFALLCAAGNDTTKQTTTHTVRALSQNPDQRDYLLADIDGRIDTAIEEFLRWASPVMNFRRTALREFEIGGVTIQPGEQAVMFYTSANRDESVFDAPNQFNITRKPNPHLAFGGGGPHYCLGAHVAKMQLKAVITELYRRLPDLTVVDEPEYLESNFINGIKRLHVRFTPERR
jgi:cytochrome P450